uniref:restriction endonuclease subunit S n=1 Tax=Olsenella uli TaxID=133926 RepID=UPI0028EE9D27|nr:restriction endonuclease subunit S [Olsenella uli]
MEHYSEYCESGTGWLGELPYHWQLRRISALYDARNEKVSDQDYPPLSVTMQGIVPQLETAAKTQDGDNRKLVRTGDFIINSRSDRRGACGISAYDGSVTLISNVLAPKDRIAMSTRYYSYLFRSEGFADEFYRQGTGIVDDLWSTNWTRMKNILVSRPPLTEQERIADYLDAKTAEIDALVADCEREVELLREYRKAVISEAVTKGLNPDAPMKDSGVEWIGVIPARWGCENLGAHSWMLTPMRDKPEDLTGPIPWVRIEDYSGKYISASRESLGVSAETVVEMNLKVYPVGTLLCTSSCDLGKCAIVAKELVSNQRFIGIIPTDYYIDYLYYLMLSNAKRLNYLSAGTIQANLSRKSFEHLKLPYPPNDEQRAIADYLDDRTAEIDSLIESKQAMTDKLREYRRSLISEAVTGKFKVPGADD